MKKLGKFKILAIATLSAIALAASIAVAQSVKTGQDVDQSKGQRSRGAWHGGHGRGEGKQQGWGGMHDGLFKQLNLTDDQKAKIKQIRENFAATNRPHRRPKCNRYSAIPANNCEACEKSPSRGLVRFGSRPTNACNKS